MSDSITNNKRIVKNTLLLYFRMLFILGVSLFTSRVVLQTLGIEDFGIYNVVGGIITMFTFINSAMVSSTQRYLNYELATGNTQKLRSVFNTSLQIHLLIAAAIILLGETVGLWLLLEKLVIPDNRMTAAMWVYQCSIVSCAVSVLATTYNADIVAHEKMSAFAYISILEVSLKLFIVYLLYISPYDTLVVYAILILLTQIFIRFICSNYCYRHFEESRFNFKIDKPLFKEMFGFAGWSFCGNLASIFFTQGLNMMLNIFFGPVVNAARGIAVQVQSAVQQFVSNFQMAINPQITKNYAINNLEQMHSLMFRSARFSFLLLFFISLPVLLETKFLLTLWLKTVPDNTVIFTQIMICISLLFALANPLMIANQSTGNIKVYQLVVGGLYLTILPISYMLLELGVPAYSVFIVHFFVEIVAQFFRMVLLNKLINLPICAYFKNIYIPLVASVAVSIILPIIVRGEFGEGWLRFIFVGFTCVLSVGISAFLIGFTKNEREFVWNKIIGVLKNEYFMKLFNILLRRLKRVGKIISCFLAKLYFTIMFLITRKRNRVLLNSWIRCTAYGVRRNNWGDDINYWLFRELTDQKLFNLADVFPRLLPKDQVNILPIGSIIEYLCTSDSVIWGSGAQNALESLEITPREVVAVRGPLTRKLLLSKGISCPEIYGDPALLLSKLYRPIVKKKYRIGIIPHYVDFSNCLIQDFVQKGEDVLVISMKDYSDWHEIPDKINECDLILSSSLHGLIISDSYNVPNVWVAFSDKIKGGGFKYLDYFASVGRSTKAPVFIRSVEDFSIAINESSAWKPIIFDPKALIDCCPFNIKTSKICY